MTNPGFSSVVLLLALLAIQLGLNASVTSAVATDEAIYFAVYRNQLNQPGSAAHSFDLPSFLSLELAVVENRIVALNQTLAFL